MTRLSVQIPPPVRRLAETGDRHALRCVELYDRWLLAAPRGSNARRAMRRAYLRAVGELRSQHPDAFAPPAVLSAQNIAAAHRAAVATYKELDGIVSHERALAEAINEAIRQLKTTAGTAT